LGGVPLILESLVPFDRELSVLAVRGLDGTVACWPLVENHHEDGILRVSAAPAPGLTDGLTARGEELATRLLDDLDHVGVLAVELFEVGGELLANEIAPRVHNSGHWTIEGAVTSQFENHVRAVLGWPLGSTAARGPSAMVNCIGAMPSRHDILAIPGAHLHDYGKSPRRGRKLGHVTVVADDRRELAIGLDAVRALVHAT
jgi:5-(carboxyamino)imidazole ribonucleotide synthase